MRRRRRRRPRRQFERPGAPATGQAKRGEKRCCKPELATHSARPRQRGHPALDSRCRGNERQNILTRDYYLVEDADGHRFWLYREGLYERETAAARWFVHGLFA